MTSLPAHTLPLPLPEEMRRWDAAAIGMGLPELLLMENASRAALSVLYQELGPLHGKRVLLFMGSGNNGGDAACLSRHLHDAGALPLVLHSKALRACTGAAGRHARLALHCGVPFVRLPFAGTDEDIRPKIEKRLPSPWQTPHVVVDGLLGTGFEGPLRPDLHALIRHINALAAAAFVLALDVPSGCNACTGRAEPEAVHAHATVCFAAAKPGLALPEARPFTGRLHARAIGIPRAVQEDLAPSFRLLTGRGAAALLPASPPGAHKNAFGHVLVLGGSPGLSGAPHFAALAALRSGAGLATVAAPAALCSEIKMGLPEVMTLPMEGRTPHAWPEAMDEALITLMGKTTALVVGPGMGVSREAGALLESVLSLPGRPPAVLDADALTMLAHRPELRRLLGPGDILTPHPGEAGRLLGVSSTEVQADRVAALHALAALVPCAITLKGAGALLLQGHKQKPGQGPMYILPHDIPALAVAGSGDVLSGCAAAFLARGLAALPAAALAMVAHVRAGTMVEQDFPLRGNLAGDIASRLPGALASLSLLPEVLCADFSASDA